MDIFNPIYLLKENKRELSEDLILYLYILVLIFIIYNITNIIYGRDVGYEIEKVDLSSDLQAISATAIRSKL